MGTHAKDIYKKRNLEKNESVVPEVRNDLEKHGFVKFDPNSDSLPSA